MGSGRYTGGSTEEALYTFALLNLVDIATTIGALKKGGYELNPVAAWLIKKMGYAGLFFLKYLAMALIVLVGHLQGNLEASLWVNNLILGGVAAWNSYVNYRLTERRRG